MGWGEGGGGGAGRGRSGGKRGKRKSTSQTERLSWNKDEIQVMTFVL